MDFHEDLAEFFETEPHAELRRDFAERYRKLIGVYPDQRQTFREGLERVRDGGGMRIADMIATLRRNHHTLHVASLGKVSRCSPV